MSLYLGVGDVFLKSKNIVGYVCWNKNIPRVETQSSIGLSHGTAWSYFFPVQFMWHHNAFEVTMHLVDEGLLYTIGLPIDLELKIRTTGENLIFLPKMKQQLMKLFVCTTITSDHQWRTQKIFMGCFIQWHMVVICIRCALFVMSQFDLIFMFPNQHFGEVCWHNMHILPHALSLFYVLLHWI